jgi:SpoIID/LytB domain protein
VVEERTVQTWNGRRIRRAATVVVMALVVPAVVIGPPGGEGSARADQSVGRPADGVFTVQGLGYGHGRGMSQYGAYGAASQGGTAQQILDFYYPGTGTGTASLSQIKIALTDDNSDVDVYYDGGLAVTDVASGAGAMLPAGAVRWRVLRSGSGLALQYLQNGAWIAWSIPNSAATYAGPLKFWDTDSPTVKVNLPDGARNYRGAVMGVTSGTGLRTVNELGLDDYVRGVVARESPASWPAAALQAQAVAARSYAVYLAQHKGGTFWDLCDTTACQVYGGATSETGTTDTAVAATAMQVRTYGGQAIFAEFSSSNGGYTVAGSMPYFVAKPDPYDGLSNSAAHSWSVTLSAASIESKYSIGSVQAVTILARDGLGEWGGRVTGKVRFSGTNGAVEVTGDQVRQAFGLKSNWFVFIGGGPAIQARYNGDPDLKASLGAPVGAEQYSNGVAWQVYQNGRLYWSAATGVHVIRSGILQAFLDAGGPSAFGAPTSDEAYTAGGAYNTFANDVIFLWSDSTGAHFVRGGIRTRWGQLGSEWGRLGFPTTNEVYIAGGVYSTFTGGRIYWSASTGAWEVVGGIGTEWLARGGPQSGSGFPAGGDMPAGGGGAYQRFASGWTMFWSPATGAHVVRGGVQAKWREIGAEWSELGYPDGDEVYPAGGTTQRFAHGYVLWSGPTGAHTMVDGPALTAWEGLGGATRPENMPTTDQGSTRAGGTWQNFYGGYSLFWSQSSGAHVLRGGLRAFWRTTGAEWGPLGYPTSEELYLPGGNVRQTFQGGTLEYSAATGTVSQVA